MGPSNFSQLNVPYDASGRCVLFPFHIFCLLLTLPHKVTQLSAVVVSLFIISSLISPYCMHCCHLYYPSLYFIISVSTSPSVIGPISISPFVCIAPTISEITSSEILNYSGYNFYHYDLPFQNYSGVCLYLGTLWAFRVWTFYSGLFVVCQLTAAALQPVGVFFI